MYTRCTWIYTCSSFGKLISRRWRHRRFRVLSIFLPLLPLTSRAKKLTPRSRNFLSSLFSIDSTFFFFFLPNIEKYKAASSKRNLTKTRIRRSKKNEAMRRCMQKESRSRRVHAIVDVQTGWSVTTDGNNNGNNNNEGKLLVWRDRSKVRIPRRPGFRRWAKVGRITAELLSAKRGNRIDSDYRRPIFDFPTTGSRNLARFIPCSANGCHRCWLNIVYR